MANQLEGLVIPAVLPENLSMVPVPVQAVLGTRKLSVRAISELQPGSLIATGTRAGGPVELYINSQRIASGDVQIQDDRLSVQIVELPLKD